MELSVMDVSAQLLKAVDDSESELKKISAADASAPVLEGGWSRKQVLSHLIDSASNNHQRFVRACLQQELIFPNYEQTTWSSVQFPQEADWAVILPLWASFNRFLAHIIERLPQEKLGTLCTIGDNEPVTLRFLIEDYMDHLLHHLRQLGVKTDPAA